MRIVYGLALSMLYSWVFVWSYTVTRDIFSPMCFFPFMQLVAYVPGILFFDTHQGVHLDEVNTFYVFVAQITVLFFTWIGYAMGSIHVKKRRSSYEIIQAHNLNMTWIGLGLFGIGLIFTSYFIHSSGGISYILAHTKVEYANQRSYLYSLNKLMPIGMLCFFQSKKKPNTILLVVTFSIYALTAIVFTKRAPIMEALLLLTMARHYRVRRFKATSLLRPEKALIVLIAAIVVVSLPMLRNPMGFFNYNSLSEILAEGWGNLNNIFEEYSFVARDAFVYTSYNTSSMYFGRVIINLIAAPLPSSRFPWKPPVDDGVYLANFMRGYYVLPPSNDYPIVNSIPFSSQGSMFANFGMFGVVLGALVMGIAYARSYNMLRTTNYHVLSIFVYQTVMYKLQLSAKNVTQTLVLLIMGIISFGIFSGSRLHKRTVKTKKGE